MHTSMFMQAYTYTYIHTHMDTTYPRAHATTSTCLSGLSCLMFYPSASTFLPERDQPKLLPVSSLTCPPFLIHLCSPLIPPNTHCLELFVFCECLPPSLDCLLQDTENPSVSVTLRSASSPLGTSRHMVNEGLVVVPVEILWRRDVCNRIHG